MGIASQQYLEPKSSWLKLKVYWNVMWTQSTCKEVFFLKSGLASYIADSLSKPYWLFTVYMHMRSNQLKKE